jgi:hypothetical protein
MLTPAEEMGLSGLSLASRVRKTFYQIPEPELAALLHAIHDEALRRRVLYHHDEGGDDVHIMPCPITALPDQIAYIHSVTLTLHGAVKRMVELYLQDPAVREVLRLRPEEEHWLLDCWGPSHRENNPVFGRYDAVVDFLSPMWKDSLRFMEPNMTSVGGLHMVPNAEQVVADVVLPVLQARDDQLQLEVGQDIRELLMQELLEHLDAIGRPGRHVCLVDPKCAPAPDEQEELAHYYRERFGLKVTHADLSELRVQRGEVYCDGEVVDLAYRGYELADLFELERAGVDALPLRILFRQNRVVSSIAGDLDEKSCWEVLTDPELVRRHFTTDERQIFRRHVLWTRLLAERRTRLPDGSEGDLLPYVRSERESLVLKPNRSFGGHGVVLGPALEQAEWEGLLEQALADAEQRWVVQQLAAIPVSEFPVLGPDGRVHVEPFYTVMGFAPTKYGVGVVGRASQKHVVNVAQRGGLCVVALGQPVRLHGPARRRAAAVKR